jgi:hypothetical protein
MSKTIPLLIMITLLLSACAAQPADTGTLQGTVTVGPLSPVEIAGQPKPTPPPEVFTSRGLVIYKEGSDKIFARLNFAADGTYSVLLPVGNYIVQLPAGGIEFSRDLPVSLTIKSGEKTILNFDIDTGIR